MMKCKKIQELLNTDYLDQEADQRQEQLVKEHLAQCPICSELEKKLQTARRLFQEVKPTAVPERVWGNIRDAIIAERLKQNEFPISSFLERLRDLIFVRRPAVVLATSFFSVIILFAFFANVVIHRQVSLNKQIAAEGIAGYSLSSQNGYVLDDLGTKIEEYFL
jgi:hypothetical protein